MGDVETKNAEEALAPPALDYDALSADELYARGKHFFKVERDFSEAAECFSRCLEKRSGADPYHSSLRDCYLWFADALLTKEEESQAMFATNVGAGEEGCLPSAESVLKNAEQKEASDEALAFETFQIAYQCYMDYLTNAAPKDKEELEKEVLDASYCLIRLGDMYFTNHQFKEAADEYKRAVEMRQKHKLAERHLASLYVSLAQCQMFNGQLGDALCTFTTAKEIMVRLLMGNLPEGEHKRMRETLEDVNLQTDDLKKLIASVSAQTEQKGSQCNAGALLPQTTGNFDERKLHEDAKSAVINLEQNNTGSRRRIDISGMYKCQEHQMDLTDTARQTLTRG